MLKLLVSLPRVLNKYHWKQTEEALKSGIIARDWIQSTVGPHARQVPRSGACPIVRCMGQKGRAQLLLHWGAGESCRGWFLKHRIEKIKFFKMCLYLQEFSACSRKEEIALRSCQLDCSKNSGNDALSMEALPAFPVIECSDLLKPLSIK